MMEELQSFGEKLEELVIKMRWPIWHETARNAYCEHQSIIAVSNFYANESENENK